MKDLDYRETKPTISDTYTHTYYLYTLKYRISIP